MFSNFSNPLVESVFEMGSIIKPLTMVAGIDSGAVTATSTYHDYGFVIVNNAKLKILMEKETALSICRRF